VAYNLMKLERLVFGWSGDARWMDAYERALFNCRLGTQNSDGLKQYFFPLATGYWRAFNSPEESFWCCTGTGAEEFAKFADTIYFRRGGELFVNQFIASTLDWKDEGFVVEQVTQFPREQGTSLKIKSSRPAARTIHVRIPGLDDRRSRSKDQWPRSGGHRRPRIVSSHSQSLAERRHHHSQPADAAASGVAAGR
jgi:uncharacterized protein